MIKVSNLSYSYTRDDKYAIKDITFEISRGEIFGFLGPSGAGKSTTQKLLTGLLRMQEGTISVGGVDITDSTRSYFNRIGVSFENANVYRKLTGLENLQFHARMYQVPTADPMQLLRAVGLEDAANQRADGYSKGMLQRLVFARSMINNPDIWFLDEPTSGLDPTTASRVKEIIQERRDKGTTVFLTTHNMYIAEQLCDRVAFIVDGKIAVIDSPRKLKLQYGDRLVTIDYRDSGKLHREVSSLADPKERQRINALISRGVVETIHSQEATLEEIFIKVTGRGLN